MDTWDMIRILLITKEAAISLILYNLLKMFYREMGWGGGRASPRPVESG